MRISILLLLAAFLILDTQVGCFEIYYPSFRDGLDDLHFIRNTSYIVSNAIQVTPDLSVASIFNKSGRIVHNHRFRLWGEDHPTPTSFNTTFLINITPRTSPGGEGLAFILTGDSSLPDHSSGQWLGIVNQATNGSSRARIVAIEFDTRRSYPEDVDGNHVGLDVNSVYSIRQESLLQHGVNLTAGGDKGTDVYVHVSYNGTVVSVFVSMTDDDLLDHLVISEPLDLSAYLPEEVYVGFAGSTSDYTELNCVRSWEFYADDVDAEKSNLLIVIAVPIAALVLLCGVLCLLYWNRKHRIEIEQEAYPRLEDQISGSSMAPRKFKLKELKRATGNFDLKNKLGSGGFGTVYKGHLLNRDVAVKRISENSRQGKQEFIAEVTTIGSLHHKNLVKLIGWCYERHDLLLVYEFMPNFSLDKHIFPDKKLAPGEEDPMLCWGTRSHVIFGVAQALDYLHNGCERKVLHRDVKASNIMLDSEFNARLGDFGLARTIQQNDLTHHSTQAIAGTPGYMAPECLLTGRATEQTDVYAFGVLVLVVVCGRKPGNQSEEDNDYNNSIVYWLWNLRSKNRMLEAVDRKLKGEFESEEMECLMILGLACCHPNPHKRPSMKIVLQVLTGEADPPYLPMERPAFMWPAMPPSFSKECDNSLTGGQITPFTQLSGR